MGNPFSGQSGAIQDFNWFVTLFDASGNVVWTSSSTIGTTRQIVIPGNIMVPGQKGYQFQCSAESLEKVPGVPAYLVDSIKYPAN